MLKMKTRHQDNTQTTSMLDQRLLVLLVLGMKLMFQSLKLRFIRLLVKEVSTVKSEPSISPRGSVVLPDRNQFFKFARPNQVWVPKKV